MSFLDFILNHKKKLIFLGGSILLYKHYLADKVQMVREVYSAVSTMDMPAEDSRKDSYKVEKEMSAVFKFINSLLKDEFSLEAQISTIKNKKYQKDQLRQTWELFKESTFKQLIIGVYCTRIALFLTQVSVKSFERIKKETGLSSSEAKEVMERAWEIIKANLTVMASKAADRIKSSCCKVELQSSMKVADLKELIENLFEETVELAGIDEETVLADLDCLLEVVDTEIEGKQRLSYCAKTTGIEFSLEYFKYFGDILESSAGTLVLVKGLEEDKKVLLDLIEDNFGDSSLPMTKILSLMAKIGTEMTSEENNMFSYNLREEEYNQYYSAFLDNLS